MRREVGQYTAQIHTVSNIVHKDPGQRASVLQHVSHNVRRLRHAAELSQSALAEKSGVSRRMLVAIEAGEKNVSLSTLDRVAEALDVAFSDLIQAPDARDPSRINELAWAGLIPGSKAVLLAKANACREVELWEWRLEPGEQYLSEPDAEGWSEQLYVFEGCLTLVLGEQERRLDSGEFFMFASNLPHAYRNDGAVAVRFVRNVVI
ncbi:transcriptional regulator, XRE family with cupin sensor [Pseudomonas sp. LAMO17WK12:I10]|nr:transcriptional regulator with XRE-family HTH domain [Pseudomonas sp. LAMO17WK12:I9]SNY30128.1 transcriptional regulator, XRE family with cupin sensor [Pseudomonas sp. LAMO17WK12:I10]